MGRPLSQPSASRTHWKLPHRPPRALPCTNAAGTIWVASSRAAIGRLATRGQAACVAIGRCDMRLLVRCLPRTCIAASPRQRRGQWQGHSTSVSGALRPLFAQPAGAVSIRHSAPAVKAVLLRLLLLLLTALQSLRQSNSVACQRYFHSASPCRAKSRCRSSKCRQR